VDSQSFVGEKHLTSSRNLGLAISFAMHVFLGTGFVALNTVTAEQADFESLEVQSLEVNTLSADELQAIIALLELDPEVSEEGTNLSVIPVNEKAASATLIGAKSNSDSSPVELPQVTEEKEIPEPEPEPKPEPEPEPERKVGIKSKSLEQLPDLEDNAVEERKIEVEPETDKTEKLEDLGEDKTGIEDQKETDVTKADKPDQSEIVEEDETVFKGEDDTIEAATISKELSELKKLSLEDLEALEQTIPESAKNKTISLGKVLKGFKLDTKNLNLKKLRKKGEISKTGKGQVTEVITKNSALFAKGKSKISRKIKKLGVVQSSNYGQAVYSYIVEQWTLPAQLSPHLELKMRLKIAKDGTLLQYSFVKVSGNRIFDQSLKSVFAKLKTLPPLPDDFDGKLTEIGLKFTPNMENISYKILVE